MPLACPISITHTHITAAGRVRTENALLEDCRLECYETNTHIGSTCVVRYLRRATGSTCKAIFRSQIMSENETFERNSYVDQPILLDNFFFKTFYQYRHRFDEVTNRIT